MQCTQMTPVAVVPAEAGRGGRGVVHVIQVAATRGSRHLGLEFRRTRDLPVGDDVAAAVRARDGGTDALFVCEARK
jgi:hypothetical protein